MDDYVYSDEEQEKAMFQPLVEVNDTVKDCGRLALGLLQSQGFHTRESKLKEGWVDFLIGGDIWIGPSLEAPYIQIYGDEFGFIRDQIYTGNGLDWHLLITNPEPIIEKAKKMAESYGTLCYQMQQYMKSIIEVFAGSTLKYVKIAKAFNKRSGHYNFTVFIDRDSLKVNKTLIDEPEYRKGSYHLICKAYYAKSAPSIEGGDCDIEEIDLVKRIILNGTKTHSYELYGWGGNILSSYDFVWLMNKYHLVLKDL